MKKILPFILGFLLALAGILVVIYLLKGSGVAVLHPKGIIALKERNLIKTALLLMLVVVVPVFILTGVIAWKYRASNTKATYTPDWDHSNWLEAIWWGFPCAIILVLAIITWNSSHDLDPFKTLTSSVQPVTIQVVALDWKWLFIYPDQNIATVNYVEFPENTPVSFVLTSDAPMNSFWIPQLGGQIYTMAGMSTQLHLMASETGDFNGVSANLSGKGFSGMKFTAHSATKEQYNSWVELVHQSAVRLSQDEYTTLSEPTENSPVQYFSSVEQGIYASIILKYMGPQAHTHATEVP